MRKMKKLAALILAGALVLGMSTTAFAATKDSATITINNAADADLSYVQVIEPNNTSLTGWAFTNDTIANCYTDAFGLTDDDAATAAPDTATEVIKQAALAMMIKKVNADATFNTGVPAVNAATNAQIDTALSKVAANVELDGMDNPQTVTSAGVYAIKAVETGFTYKTMAAYVGFDEVVVKGENGDVTYDYPSLVDTSINAKKSPTTITKADKDADNAVAIDDIVTYTIEMYVPYVDAKYTGENRFFTITDKIDGAEYYLTGEDAVSSVVVEGIEGQAGTIVVDKTVADANYDQSFTIDLSDVVTLDNKYAGNKITVTYTAKVTEVTVDNHAAGHMPGKDLDADEIFLYTGKITLVKHDAANNTVKLEKAEFNVTKDASTTPLTFVQKDTTKSVYTFDKEGTVTTLVTDANGEIVIEGLDIGTYTFTETKAPDGYSINKTPVTATLVVEEKNANNEATAIFDADTAMADTKLAALPSTGGIGTTIFTIGGVVIIVAAASMLFARRRVAR